LISPLVRASTRLANCLAAVFAGWSSCAKCAQRRVSGAALSDTNGADNVSAAPPALVLRNILRSMVFSLILSALQRHGVIGESQNTSAKRARTTVRTRR